MRKGKSSMKQKNIFIALVAILSLVCGSFTRISAYADFDSAESRGNFILSGEELSLRASDMDYLYTEVHDLYGELPSIIGAHTLAAGKARRDDIRSIGIVNYGNGAVVLNSFDFIRLADEIDNLESEYKANAVAALNRIGTFFKPDGSLTHDDQDKETVSPQFAAGLTYDAIYQGIKRSQSVDHLTAAPAAENNISAGAAAWVNGQCIIGTGKDVQDAYDRGYNEGYEEGYRQGDADGYDRGYDEGDADGYNRGYDEGDQNGYERGYGEGDRDAYERGYADGYKQGKSDGYNQGYADGYAARKPDNAEIKYTYHKHTDACFGEQEVDCYIIFSPGEVFYRWCAGCNKENPDAQTKWQRYTIHHTICDVPDSAGEACTEHSGVPASEPHKIKSTVCVCGKTEETIESVTIIYHN